MCANVRLLMGSMMYTSKPRLLLIVIFAVAVVALIVWPWMSYSSLTVPPTPGLQEYAADSTGFSAAVIGTSSSASQNDYTTRNVTEWERKPEPLLEVAKQRYPDSIIIGCKKSGTGTLLTMLNAHPDIQARLSEHPEVDYYSNNKLYSRGLSWYIGQMPLARKKDIVMEKSNYFEYPESIGRIYKDSKTVKLILIVRNPVKRAISDYVNFKLSDRYRNKPFPKFEDIVIKNGIVQQGILKIVYLSLYDVHFIKWLHFFKKDQILVVNGEQLISQPSLVLKQVEIFLGLKEFFNDEMFFEGSNGFFCSL